MSDAPRVPFARQGRALVAIDPSRESKALETALDLASRLVGAVHGLFVEDPDLLRVADLPFSRRFGHMNPQGQPLERAELEAAWTARAHASRNALSTLAHERRLSWTFEVTRSRLLALLTGQAHAEDLLVVVGAHIGRSASWRGPVRVLAGGAPLEGPGEALVTQIVSRLLTPGEPLTRLDPTATSEPRRANATSTPARPAPEDGDEVERIRALVAARPGGVLVLRADDARCPALLRPEVLRTLHCTLLIVPRPTGTAPSR